MAETPMDNSMRRLLAHLGVPRTLEGLTERLMTDPDVGQVDVGDLLDEAHDNGWIANVGSSDEPADVVEDVEKSKEAIGFGKGQDKIWQQRAEAGRYQFGGDLYMLSEEGLSALQGTDEEEQE